MNRNRVLLAATVGVASVVVMWSAGASARAAQETTPAAVGDARVETKVLEVLVELDAGQTLPVGLRVDAFMQQPGGYTWLGSNVSMYFLRSARNWSATTPSIRRWS